MGLIRLLKISQLFAEDSLEVYENHADNLSDNLRFNLYLSFSNFTAK